MSSQLFVNPYNFIPFGSTIEERRRSRENLYRGQNRLISGWLEAELDTKTPLIIPDGAHPEYWDTDNKRYVQDPDEDQKKKLHKEYKFFRIPGEDGEGERPVIPGSELRGMLRSVYETATDSCVAFLLDDKPISQRVPAFGSLRKRGLLAYEETISGSGIRRWVLYSTYAERKEVEPDGGRLKYKDGRAVTEKNGDYIENHGWLQYNIPVNPKGKYSIAYLRENEKIYTWDFIGEDGKPDEIKNEEPYRALKSALQDRPKGLKNRNEVPNRNLQNALERAKQGKDNKIPVYYFMVKRGDETLVYLSNSSIGRIAQRRKWKEIMGAHAPCDNTDRLCPACLLFGTVRDRGLKGHIRVTDAEPVGDIPLETHTLPILGEPRTSAFEFYLKRPEGKQATYWNFDFYGEKVRDSNGKSHTEYHDLEEAAPRGRKRYWHSMPAADASKSRMNSTVEAANGTFKFRVYFDEVTEEQLQDLIWVITLGDNRKESTKQHKLGHAKPLGYGSVKITVKEKVIRNISAQEDSIEIKMDRTEYKDIIPEPGKDLDPEAVRTLLLMSDTQTIPENIPVEYPTDLDKQNIFTWFANNRINPDRLKTLPEPGDKELVLSKNGKKTKPKVYNKPENSRPGRTVRTAARISGKVKFYDMDRNFGYIAGEDGTDYRISINSTNRRYNPDISPEDLKKGCAVTFEPVNLHGKWTANQCRLEQ